MEEFLTQSNDLVNWIRALLKLKSDTDSEVRSETHDDHLNIFFFKKKRPQRFLKKKGKFERKPDSQKKKSVF